jgi:hypothetical protein
MSEHQISSLVSCFGIVSHQLIAYDSVMPSLVISGFLGDVDEICALLGYSAA